MRELDGAMTWSLRVHSVLFTVLFTAFFAGVELGEDRGDISYETAAFAFAFYGTWIAGGVLVWQATGRQGRSRFGWLLLYFFLPFLPGSILGRIGWKAVVAVTTLVTIATFGVHEYHDRGLVAGQAEFGDLIREFSEIPIEGTSPDSGPIQGKAILAVNGRWVWSLDRRIRAQSSEEVGSVIIINSANRLDGRYESSGRVVGLAIRVSASATVFDRYTKMVIARKIFSADPPQSVRVRSSGRMAETAPRAIVVPEAISWVNSLPRR